MANAVLISINPEWCGMIAYGEKTIEIRKTKPKLETPFKCYIYCTLPKSSGDIYLVGGEKPVQANGRVIGEFVCDKISVYEAEFYEDNKYYQDIQEVFENENGVSYQYITSNSEENPDACDLCKASCLTFDEIKKYIGKKRFDFYFYGWHISDLVIYDKPKELSEFYRECDGGCEDCDLWQWVRVNADEFDMECSSSIYGHKPLKKSPQSWCYVEELTNV